MQVKPGIQFVASLGQPSTVSLTTLNSGGGIHRLHRCLQAGQVGTMEVQDARGYHPELRVFFSDPERNRIDLDIFA